ncbi:MAG TPA: M28 family metallopeptidase, partial [Myxococcota bacterium]|nr:M28 family metallopeptidase [Myxococcota bacterium]
MTPFIVALFLAAPPMSPLQTAEKAIESKGLLERIQTMASDVFEGRSPGTKGEEVTVAYLVDQMKAIGLEPGNPDGTYLQRVPLVGAVSTYRAELDTQGKREELLAHRDLVAVSQRQVPKVSIDKTDMVFVGYGVVAPEYGWDDFKDVDVRGKTVVMLINDPQVADPADPTKLDPKLFKGPGMTYYGRWTYKFEIAAKKGAVAALIIHNTERAAYPWSVVVDSWGRENFATVAADKNAGRAAIESWITEDAARRLFKDSGLDLEALTKAAALRDFKPVPLRQKLSMTLERTERQVQSHNVIGKISGSEAADAARYLVYSAHWDHFGRDDKREGDKVFHGALDNASGTSGMLEIAEAFKALNKPAKATVVFVATTGEERGLLGAKYYVENPLYPLARTLANINLDGVNPWGRTKDLQLVGDRVSTLDEALEWVTKQVGRVLVADAHPERGTPYRGDSFEFAKAGVPALWLYKGNDYIGKAKGFGDEQSA